MTERPTDEELRRLLARYNPPPDLPAERLWEAIEAVEPAGGGPVPSVARGPGLLGGRPASLARPALAAAALALFVLGGAAGYAVAGARGEDGPTPAAEVGGGGEGEVLVHRITWL